MSRIQEILKKAERDGAVHRTRGVAGTSGATAEALVERPAFVMPEPVSTPAPVPAASHIRQVSVGLDPRLVAAGAPQSLAAEQYRSLRARVTRAENGRAFRTIIITSPNKGDGKSLTAADRKSGGEGKRGLH